VINLTQKVLNAPIVQEAITPATVGVTGAGMSWIAISHSVSSAAFLITGIGSAVLIVFTAFNMYYKFKLTKLSYEKARQKAAAQSAD
jgi:hypothetical protein